MEGGWRIAFSAQMASDQNGQIASIVLYWAEHIPKPAEQPWDGAMRKWKDLE